MKSKFLKISGLVLFVCLSANSAFAICEEVCCGKHANLLDSSGMPWNIQCSNCQKSGGQLGTVNCSIHNTLASYCVNCGSTLSGDSIPVYKKDVSGKPTSCYCDYRKGLIYQTASISCVSCYYSPNGPTVATYHATECKPFDCPANTYLKKVSTSEYGQCPKNSVLSKRVDASQTYNP